MSKQQTADDKQYRLKAVIFDCGGVLVAEYRDPLFASFRLHDLLIRAGGLKLRQDAFSAKISERQMWHELSTRLNLGNDYIAHLKDHLLNDRELDKKIFDLAKNLKKNYKVAIISDGVRSIFRHWSRKFQFKKVFGIMVLSADVGLVKPKSPIFKLALKKIGVQPAEALFIDDLAVNVSGARKAGIRSFRYNGRNYKELVTWLKKNGVKL